MRRRVLRKPSCKVSLRSVAWLQKRPQSRRKDWLHTLPPGKSSSRCISFRYNNSGSTMTEAVNRKAICRHHGVYTSSIKVAGIRVAYNWNLLYSHILIDSLWTGIEDVFHKHGPVYCSGLENQISERMDLFTSTINRACDERQLPASCRTAISRLSTLIDKRITHYIGDTNKRCREVPAALLDAVKAGMRKSLTPTYKAAALIVYDPKGKRKNAGR